MRDQKDLLLLIPTIAAMLFLVDYSFSFSYGYAERQSQSTNTICYGSDNSCYTTFCSDDQPCQTLSSDQPNEEVAVMQPVEVTEKYVDATLEDCEDGVDNDVDGKVDVTDEECNANTSYISPVHGQETSLSDKYGGSGQVESEDESSDDDDGGDDKKDYNEQEDDSEDNR
jgi:cobalamin biosynthesis protein CobT